MKMVTAFRSNMNVRFSLLQTSKPFSASKMRLLESKQKVVFLGTPDVAASCLKILQAAASKEDSKFEVIAVVTQPPAPAGRNKKSLASPVQVIAEELSIHVFSPEKANNADFLLSLAALAPDLCITAAYGNYLPKKFLSIPRCGTVNIHPSLLPKYRGAAPVQRCLEAGDPISGVSLLFTVQKMDAGPIISQHQVVLSGTEKAPEFLDKMFAVGANLLLESLPAIFSGDVIEQMTEQDETQASDADKLSPLDARTDFTVSNALHVHNKVRGLAGWPGVWSTFRITAPSDTEDSSSTSGGDEKGLMVEAQRIKIITTNVIEPSFAAATPTTEVAVVKNGKKYILRVVCGDGSILGIEELQPPGKKVMAVRDFLNGLRGASLEWTVPPL